MSKKHYDKSSGSRCSADDVTYKRIRLTDLKRGRYASTNAIAHLLDTVRRQGIPECSSASAQRRARVALCSQATPFGPIVQQLEVPAKHDPARAPTNVIIPYQNPLAMLHVSVHECEPLAELMRDAVRTHGEPSLAAPWRLIWYFDEIGQSPLATVDTRKTYGTYWSFWEFGPRMLCTDNCWFVASAVRSTEVKKLEGGPSHLSKLILRTFFRNDGGDLKTGIILHVHGRDHPLIIFGVLSIVCGDLDALFKFLCSKGQNANVPCPMCTNIVSVKCGWAVGSDVLRAFTCLNYDEIKPHTDATIRALVRGLRDAAADVDAGRMSEAEFEELQTRRGWNHSPDNILFDELVCVDPASSFHIDWFHTYLQTGIFNYEFGVAREFLKSVRPPIKIDAMQAFARRFRWPKQYPSPAYLLCSEHFSKDTLHFKCSGSEALSLFPVLDLFFRKWWSRVVSQTLSLNPSDRCARFWRCYSSSMKGLCRQTNCGVRSYRISNAISVRMRICLGRTSSMQRYTFGCSSCERVS